MRIVVIGAGLLGTSTAFFLRDSGHEVTVLDSKPGPGLGTSYANGGMLTPSQAGPWNSPGIAGKLIRWLGRGKSPLHIHPSVLPWMIAWGLQFLKNSSEPLFRENLRKNAVLAGYSLKILQQIRRDNTLDYDPACRGTLKVFRSARAFDEAYKLLGLTGTNLVSYEILDNQGLATLEPSLQPVIGEIAGGIYYPDDESGDAHVFCRELAALADGAGVTFRYDTRVHGLVKQGNSIKALETSDGLVKADCYILSAGCYSPGLSAGIGLSLPIKPVKGYSVTFSLGPDMKKPGMPVIDESRHIAITPFMDRIRVSGIAELCGFNTSLDNNRIGMMTEMFRDLFPALYPLIDQASRQCWSGLRPYTCDGVPIIGRSEIDNLFLNTGHGHLGWTMAAGSGKLMADLVCHGETELDPAPYSINRFKPHPA